MNCYAEIIKVEIRRFYFKTASILGSQHRVSGLSVCCTTMRVLVWISKAKHKAGHEYTFITLVLRDWQVLGSQRTVILVETISTNKLERAQLGKAPFVDLWHTCIMHTQ